MTMKGNKGEWSEIYIFLKLMENGRVYAADENMNRIKTVYLNIKKIIREEIKGKKIEYYTGDPGNILLNGIEYGPETNASKYGYYRQKLWDELKIANRGNGIVCDDVEKFLDMIHIHKLKAPAAKSSMYFGGTQDITMQIEDYRSGAMSVVGFSCKSDFSSKSTLFNASKDNTNFIFEIIGSMSDDIMNEFNNTFDYRNQCIENPDDADIIDVIKKPVVAIKRRMAILKKCGCTLEYIGMPVNSAERNIVLSGGQEMPVILANMLKAYYFDGEGQAQYSSIESGIQYVCLHNVASYDFEDIESIYRRKVGDLLYDMFTGMRLSKPWDGRREVNGGYIIAKNDGEVLAYHTIIADEFKDFLVRQLGFESPSASRHDYMSIYKNNNRYYLKLNLQVRFKGNIKV